MHGKCLSTSTLIHRLIHVSECKIFLFELFKMSLNNKNCHDGELEYYSQVGIGHTVIKKKKKEAGMS